MRPGPPGQKRNAPFTEVDEGATTEAGKFHENLDVPPVRSLLGIIVLAAVAAGCGRSGHQFIENEDLGVFAKLPDGWAVFDEEDLLASTDDEVTDLELERVSSRLWFRGFHSGDDPAAEDVFDLTASEPRGFVQIRQLSTSEREQVNLTAMRGFDPSSPPSSETGTSVEVISDEPAEFDGGYHGVHTVFAMTEGDEVALVDQTALLNSTNSTLYMFVVGCDEQCFLETYKDDINEIVDSWTIQENGA
jgi:hypothetical protein